MLAKPAKPAKPAKTVKSPWQIFQVFKIEDEKVEESILEWMQIEENDFLWNSQRTEYMFPDKKKARFMQKTAALNELYPYLKLSGE